jgi:hypothetical protein
MDYPERDQNRQDEQEVAKHPGLDAVPDPAGHRRSRVGLGIGNVGDREGR